MKIIFFIMALLICHPFSAEAESVFDETQAFQIAKTVRIGREKNGIAYREVDLNSYASYAEKAAPKVNCTANAFVNSKGQCVTCTDHGVCDGATIDCASGYFADDTGCVDICSGTVCRTIDPDCTGAACERFKKHPVGNRCYCY